MNNKRWYIIFSVLILLMIGYVVYVFGAGDQLIAIGITLNITHLGPSGGFMSSPVIPLTNNSEILAGALNLTITLHAANGTTNASWYIANVSEGNYYRLIAQSNVSNNTAFGIYDFATSYETDLNTLTFNTARTWIFQLNATNQSAFGGGNYSPNIVQTLTLKIYPHRLNNSNASVMINGFVRSGSINNITNNANVSGVILFNATLATNTITTNVTWYAINGSRGIVLGSNNRIGNTTVEFDTGNGTLSDGFYNITLSVTNLSNGSGIASTPWVYNPVNSFNVSVLNVRIQNVAEVGSLTAAGITLNVTHLGVKGGSINYTGGAGRELPLANNSEILAGVIALNITLLGSNLTTNASWYIANASDNYYTIIANSNISNATSYGQYDFATSFNVDLGTRTFSNARTYIILANFTNYSNFGSTGYSVANSIVKTLTLKIYPHRLMNNRNNNTVIIDGEYTKRDGTVTGLSSILSTAGYLINVSTQINVTGQVILNATIAPGNITTNVSWYARGDTDGNGVVEEIVIGLNHSIGGTRILWDTNNLSGGLYNITLHVTNLSNGSGISGHVFNPANSFNKSILTVMVDNVAPAVDISLSDDDGIIYTRGEIKATCSFSDFGSGLPSTQVLELEKPNGEILTVLTGIDASNEYAFNEKETAATGTYTVRCKASDSSNQQTITEKTFQVFARGGSSSATVAAKKKAIKDAEVEEGTAVEGSTLPTGTIAAEGVAAPRVPEVLRGRSGSTIAVIVIVLIIASVGVYFILKKSIKPGQKKGQLNWCIS